MGFAIPYPGTELYNICEKDGLFLIDPNDFLISDIYNHEDQVCIKPYKLEASDISKFRKNIYKEISPFKSRDYVLAKNNTLSSW